MIASHVNASGTVTLAITRKNTLASFNVNGLLTRIKDEDVWHIQGEARTQVFALYASRYNWGSRTPHCHRGPTSLVQKALGRFNYKIHCALTPRRGGVAVIYHMHWEPISHIQVDERLLYVVLSDPDGICFSFLVGHLHHGAGDRDAHWKKLQTHFHSFHSVQLFVLADFNSVIVPSRDSAVPNDHKSKASVEAGKTKIHGLSKLNITNAHLLMHAHYISFPEKSCQTWGFPSATRSSPSKVPKRKRARTHTQMACHQAVGTHGATLTGSYCPPHCRAPVLPVTPHLWEVWIINV